MRLKRITCFALILLICFPVNILAESGNSVSIRLKNLGTAMEGVRFDVYKVGTMDGYTPVIDSRFRINSFPREAYKLDNTARYISGMLSGNADSNGETDANGSLVFDGLADGVYLIRVSQSNDYGTISPFLVCLPYYENEKKCNSVEVEPKASNPNIEDTDTFIPEVQDKNTSTPSLVKTGDTTEFLSYISIFILSLIVFLSLLLQKRKKGGKL